MIEVPRAFQGKPAATRALRLKALLSIIALGWAAFFVQHVATGMTRMAITDAAAVLLTATVCVWAVRSGSARSLDVAAHLAMAVSCGAIFAVSMFSGQDAAMATWYLTAVPLFSAYALGTRAAVMWAGIASAMILAVYLSPLVVHFEPEYVPNEQTWLIGRFVLLGVLLGLAVATRRATDHNVDALAQRELIIRERARELAEARDEALAAVRAKDEFLANMSHEIRTPLNGIIGMTSVLLDVGQSEDQREMVKTIQRSSNALLAVLNEILDFSKLEASAVVLEQIPFDLRECVEDAIDLLGRAAFEKGLDIYVRIDRDVPRWIEGDITYVRQVLLNLIGNAIKFTESGEVAVHVHAPELNQLHFEIRDTGIGIPAEKHDVLFRSFSQVDTSTTRKYGGTGLGLAISKRLVELLGGEIWVQSVPGEGSTFHFTIAAQEAEAPVRPMTTHERVTLVGCRAVLVGGRPGSHHALAELLERWGLDVNSQLDPTKLQPETVEDVDMIIAFENALSAVGELDDRPPLVQLVPLSDTDRRAEAAAVGAEAIVFRPVRQRALRQTLEAVVQGGRIGTAGPSYSTFDPSMGERLPARVLVGEDNPVNQRVAITVLEKLGYAPDVVSDGTQVVDALRRREYDIVFLDLQMPAMDGFQTTQTIRESSECQPWIVALTASVGTEIRRRVEQAGMDDFVSKPFDVQTLMVAIERWAAARGLLDDPSAQMATEESPWQQLQAMFASSPERLAALLDEHRRNGASLVASIEAAWQSGDRDEVATHAHALKSSAAQFGSDDVASVAAALEEHARSRGSQPLDHDVRRLSRAWRDAERRLDAVESELRGGSVVPERA